MFAYHQSSMIRVRAAPLFASVGWGEQRRAILHGSRTHKAGKRLDVGVRRHGKFTTRASNLEEDLEKVTVGGGSYSGKCDVDTMRDAAKECEGLTGAALEACWADLGCDRQEVAVTFEMRADGTFSRKNAREEQTLHQTVGGGGYDGTCDIDDIKRLRKDCEGLTGEALRACWADAGCDVDEVTRHYTAVAGIEKDEYRVYIAHDGSMVADGLTTGEYNISAWNAGVKENAAHVLSLGQMTDAISCKSCYFPRCLALGRAQPLATLVLLKSMFYAHGPSNRDRVITTYTVMASTWEPQN
eukprot:1186763-Prorocentrum_minimum.AAC.7